MTLYELIYTLSRMTNQLSQFDDVKRMAFRVTPDEFEKLKKELQTKNQETGHPLVRGLVGELYVMGIAIYPTYKDDMVYEDSM